MPVAALSVLSFAVAAASPAGAQSTAAAQLAAAAPGGPGTMSYFDLARKDLLSSARNTTSKAWYTVAGGVLSDVYEPTIDNTNVETLQYIVTDGSTFTDLQTRDMTYTVAADPSGMACTVTATSAKHGYRLVTIYITDPARDSVLMHTRLEAVPGLAPRSAACTCTRGWTRTSTGTAAAAARTRAATRGSSTPPPERRSR